MTIEELRAYYRNGYIFNKVTGMSGNSYLSWVRQGYVPIVSQLKIEQMTSGELVARLEDGEAFKNE